MAEARINNPAVDLARAAVHLEASAEACTVPERKASLDRVARWLWRRVAAHRAGIDPDTDKIEDGA